MSYFITIQYPYQQLEISIAYNSVILEIAVIPKMQAVELIIPTLQQLISNHGLILSDIACIGVNTGPGPFNTLRAIIATANGISFAQSTPLVSCNGLELLLQENSSKSVVAILDAFGSDVYYAIKSSNEQGYMHITDLMTKLNKLYRDRSLVFIGNGSVKHNDYIMQNYSGTALIDHNLLFANSTTLVEQTYKSYKEKSLQSEVFPLYFQSPVVK